ncbi:MAG: Asp-tRNA(Asn)/Glu-tRNA(Gln) amidotransferase subunit GatC [Firmicutes bacterium]|nr:Asp-tRNA(Asn)/Glu-tRNA(Gln) amidotransferase subunit GatC [Bacillota bacterium]
MSKFTKEMVDNYADKLLIGLSDEENKMVLDEFDEIDENLDLVNKIEGISEVEPMTHCLDDFTYELREDVVVASPDIEDILANSDDTTDREIVVPKVVG